MASFIMKVLDGSFSATRTVTDTTAHATGVSPAIRVAVDSSGNARLVAYSAHNPPSSEAAPVSTLEQRYSIATVYSCTTAATTFTKLGSFVAVKEASVPFYNSTSGRFYLNLVAFRGGTALQNVSTTTVGASSFVTDITESITSRTPAKFRVSAVLGEYTPDAAYTHSSDTYGYFGINTNQAQRPVTVSGVTLLGYGQVNLFGLRTYAMAQLRLYEQKSTHFATDVYSGGVVGRYDGLSPSECGYVQSPQVYAVDQKGGSLASGTYVYVAVWTRRDKDGRAHFSRCSEPISVVQSGGSGLIKVLVSVPTATSGIGADTVMLFRTAAGGTQFFLVESKLVSTTASGTYTGIATESNMVFSDQLADSTLTSRALFYRSPGTDSTALDRCNPLSARHIIKHKDRTFYCHKSTVYYSSFDVDGEAPWFSPGFSFDVLGGNGPITGLASMDGVLVVFKRDSVFVVEGDGPTENGGTGAEFSPPRKLNTEHGCIDPRSIVSIPDGKVFRSQQGIMLLGRSLKVAFIGERIQRTVDAYAYVGGATYNRATGRMHMVLSNTLASDGGHDYTADGVTVIFDTITNVWTKHFHNNTSAYGKSMQDCVYAQSTYNVNGDAVYYADHNNGLWNEVTTSGLDNGSFVPWKMATGWVRAASKQDRIRVSDLQFLGRWITGHNLKGEYYSNYDVDTATAIKTFDASTTAGTHVTPEQLEFQPGKELVQSMKFVLTSVTPSNPTTLGSGKQCLINGITVRIGVKGGGVKLPAAQKG